MGRHSIPDPDDQPDRPDEGSGYRYEPEPGSGSGTDFGSAPAGETSDYRDFGYETDDYGTDDPDARYRADDVDSGFFAAATPRDAGLPIPGEPGRGTAEEPPTQAIPVTGRQRTYDSGEWTGSHRALTAGRRTVSRGVIIALVTVVAVVGGVILWRFLGDSLSDRSQASADRCVEGDLTVAVIADPAISDQVGALAENYSRTADPVGDRCVKIAVSSADAGAVVDGFTGPWPGDLGERPALWIPASSASEARLEGAAGAETVIDSRSLVSSPVVVAMRPELKSALAERSWSDLPGLQSDQRALDGLNLPGWGGLRLSLPAAGNSDAGLLAAEAVAVASAPAGSPATAGAGAAQRLTAGQPELADAQASTAFDALLDAADPAAAPVHAVVTTEQRLVQRAADLPDAGSKLTSWAPSGPVAVADFPAVLLGGEGLSKEQISAASEFDRFMRKPEQLAELAKAGFRAEGAPTPESPVTDFPAIGQPLSVGDTAQRAELATRLSAPVQDGTITVMLNQSMPVDEGGRSRLANVTSALDERLQALPPSAAVGLWTFDGVSGRSAISTGALGDDVGGSPRSAALGSSLRGQVGSGGGAVSFTTLRLVYGEAVSGFRADQPNSVLVITSGPHTDRSLDGQGLVSYIEGAVDPERPVAVNVINLGDDPDRPTWEAVAEASGGTYRNVPTSTDPALAAAVSEFLG